MSLLILAGIGFVLGAVYAAWTESRISSGFECWFYNGILIAFFGTITYYSIMFAPLLFLLYPNSLIFGFLTVVSIWNIIRDIKYHAKKLTWDSFKKVFTDPVF